MTCTRPRKLRTEDPFALAHERRRQAAWLHYLESIRDVPKAQYEAIERNAWERLQRRLERNEQRLVRS